MNLRFGRGSTSVGTGRGLSEDQGENGHGDDHGNANGVCSVELSEVANFRGA